MEILAKKKRNFSVTGQKKKKKKDFKLNQSSSNAQYKDIMKDHYIYTYSCEISKF